MRAVRVVEPHRVPVVLDGQLEPATDGLAELLPFQVCRFDGVPQTHGATLADSVVAAVVGDVADPRTVRLGQPGLSRPR